MLSRNTIRLGAFSFWVRVNVMAFNATFNNISVISLRSVLLVEETGEPRKNHRPTHISHNVVSSTHHDERDSNT